MKNLLSFLGVAALAVLVQPSVQASSLSLDQTVQTLQEEQTAFVKRGGKGGRAWGRSHNRGLHLGWYKQKRRR